MPSLVRFIAWLSFAAVTACTHLPTQATVSPILAPVAGGEAIEPEEIALTHSVPEVNFLTVPVIQPTIEVVQPPNLWNKIVAKFSLSPNLDQKRVQQEIRWFKRHPDYLVRVSKRAEKYLAYIYQEVTARGLPGELVLLPIIESALDPYAFSPGGASGLWQFVPASARRFGIKSNWWFEGRRDPVQSTQGALDYLEYLHRRFDDWLLALGAYNTGEGNISKAIRRHGGKPNFWQLKVHRETASYVPRLLALASLLAQEHSELGLLDVDPQPGFTQVELPSQYDIATAARILQVKPQLIYDWNPGLNQWATPAKGPHRLLLPNHLQSLFAPLQQLPKQQRLAWKRYHIKSGDSLSEIALQFSTDIAAIRTANNIKGNQIRAGKYLLIPTFGNKSAPARATSEAVYIVRSGDSLWKIARAQKVSMNTLMRINEVGPKDTLRTGQRLKLPGSSHSVGPASNTRKVNYRVRRGDSLDRIANKFSVTIADITGWNSVSRERYLQPGQKLVLYVQSTPR